MGWFGCTLCVPLTECVVLMYSFVFYFPRISVIALGCSLAIHNCLFISNCVFLTVIISCGQHAGHIKVDQTEHALKLQLPFWGLKEYEINKIQMEGMENERGREREWTSRWRVCEMERKAHNTVTKDRAVRCSCWQRVWKHSDGQQQQLLWERGVCLIHCLYAPQIYPTLSRDLNQFSLKLCCCNASCFLLHQKER